jgi:hypothetical protein
MTEADIVQSFLLMCFVICEDDKEIVTMCFSALPVIP